MNNRPKNYAPLEQEGFYTVYVKDNKVVVTKHKDKSQRRASYGDKQEIIRCHPDDKFELGEAVNVALKRFDSFKIGDYVQIVDNGKSYTSAESALRNVDFKYVVRYRYGCLPNNGIVCKVVDIVENQPNIYILENVDTEPVDKNGKYDSVPSIGNVYVVNKTGLKKANG